MFLALGLLASSGPAMAQATTKQPNILILWGDDIGYWNVSAYNQGMMGYRTPNIDRIAKEGGLFTDWYAQQSCTAGRAAFVTGQVGFRTGLLKVGLPGAKEGLQARDVTIAELLRARGYKTGQFGKNHLGDRDEHLPTAHGFEEFFGSLYHLNAEDEPEHPDYFKDPEMRKRYATRGVIHSWAQPNGKQKIELTGPLNKKRMETVDEEFTREALRFMEEAKKEGKPFFLWWNATRMHIWTRLKAASQGKTGLGIYPDGMVEHDAMVGQLLDKLKQLGIEDNTIVMYSTDNGAEKMSWPDGGTSPFRGEKNTNWEGGFRVPCAIRWPGVIKPGTVFNDIFAHEDMLPTLLAAAGDPDVKAKLLKGVKVGSAPSRSTWTATTSWTRWPANHRVRATSSSISMTMARWSPSATTSGRSSSPSSGHTASTSGRTRSCRCDFRSSSTCVPTHSRPGIMKAWITRGGGSSTSSCWCPPSSTSESSLRPSRSSRRARSRAASASNWRWSRCSRARKGEPSRYRRAPPAAKLTSSQDGRTSCHPTRQTCRIGEESACMDPSPTVPEPPAAADQPGEPDASFTVSTHVLVPEEDVRRLRALSARTRVAQSDYLREAVEDLLKKYGVGLEP